MMERKKVVAFIISTISAVVVAIVILLLINASLLKVPLWASVEGTAVREAAGQPGSGKTDFSAIQARNLFRAKLEAELPKPRTQEEMAEEALTSIVRTMVLKGVMTGQGKKDFYAVIDRGGQKGVWTYEAGEVVERGLTVTEVRRDSITVEEGAFKARLRLFSKSFERLPAAQAATKAKEPSKKPATTTGEPKPPVQAMDMGREIRREGKTVLLSPVLVERIREDNSLILSSMAIKMEVDGKGQPTGYRVVTVDKESLAQKLGIMSGDKLLEVNGYALQSMEDLKKAYGNLQASTHFDIKILRNGKAETLRYVVR